MKSNPSKFFAVFIAVLIPFMLMMGAVKILLSFNYPGLQYGLIGFPEDSFGYNRQERTHLAAETIDYLTEDQSIAAIMQLKDSKGQLVYTPDEVAHLQDVKFVINLSSIIWYVVLGLSFAFIIWMLFTKSFAQIRHAFFWGALLTIFLMAAMVVLMVLNFNALFEKFHALFFPKGNWTFTANSGLIRLFPLPLWVNAFILTSVFALLISVLLLIIFWPRKHAPRTTERVVPTAIPSTKPASSIPSMATPLNKPEPYVDLGTPSAEAVKTELPSPAASEREMPNLEPTHSFSGEEGPKN
ncbi:MAG: DUF1461 domain-containing protein [Anaerolineaceae bacterium]|nr:DUF1461 domain-containing protein [Anaerolineaceae bacterium]